MITMTTVEIGTVCPYCDKSVRGHGIRFGSDLMHPSCYAEFGAEMERLEREDANGDLLVAAAELRFADAFGLLGETDGDGENSSCTTGVSCRVQGSDS